MLWWWTFWACELVGPAPVTAWAIDPDEACARETTVNGPRRGCDDMAIVGMAEDGTCWMISCYWEDIAYENTGASGPPDDPDWCRDSDWFSEQPDCDDAP